MSIVLLYRDLVLKLPNMYKECGKNERVGIKYLSQVLIISPVHTGLQVAGDNVEYIAICEKLCNRLAICQQVS